MKNSQSATFTKDNSDVKTQIISESTSAKIDGNKKSNKGSFKEFIAKLSRGLMLPIAMLPIAGLFLGIGSAICTQVGTSGLRGLSVFGNILKIPGDVVFACLPVLFAIAIAITFTKDSGTAGLSAFIGWIVFCGFQSALLVGNSDGSQSFLWYNYGDNCTFTKRLFQATFKNSVGILSLNTSVFGGLVVGFIVAFLYNKFKNIQLPTILGFFNGVRFVPIVTFAAMLAVSLIFCMIWPAVAIGLYYVGVGLSSAPVGLNSLVFGIVERILVPTGLHHAFYSPLWYTSAGGSFNFDANAVIFVDGGYYQIMSGNVEQTWHQIINLTGTVDGDQEIWAKLNASGLIGKCFEVADLKPLDGAKTLEAAQYLNYENITQGTRYLNNDLRQCNPGQYMQGKFAFMMFGLPAAAGAMITCADKGKKKVASSIIVSAALTSFLTGITEPFEFTFLFLSLPLYGCHCLLAGISFMLMNVFGGHVGMTFSGGFIDFVIYGLVPDVTMHAQTRCWLIPIIGSGLAVIYFFLFMFFIKKFNLQTPGRGESTKLFTKKDYQEKNNNDTEQKDDTNDTLPDQRSLDIIDAYGGLKNIVNVDACITKLRIQVADQNLVSKEKLLALGAKGVMRPSAQSVYAVFGTEAEILKHSILKIIDQQSKTK